MTKSLVLSIGLALVACNKDKAHDKADTTAAPAASKPADTTAAKPADTAATAPIAGATEGCAKYAALTVKCANGTGDVKALEMSCAKTLEKNNAMTPTMKVMVDCAGANTECDPFQKCIANTR